LDCWPSLTNVQQTSHAEFWEDLLLVLERTGQLMLSVEGADLCLFVRGVNTVSGENGNCVDRKAESRFSTVSCVATYTHTHDSARYKTICSQFALSSDR